MKPATSGDQTSRVFLTAEWRDLMMFNYEVSPALLERFVPAGTALDRHDGRLYVSLVAFRFERTRLGGKWAVPGHENFLEANLRFYVRREVAGEARRGVVFIAEIVPRWAIAAIARWVYGENYRRLPMIRQEDGYAWRVGGEWCWMQAEPTGKPALPADGSLEQFITEHYWGYTRRNHARTLEYRVSHPRWRVWRAEAATWAGDARPIYGDALATALRRTPDSAFIAEGSEVTVYRGSEVGTRARTRSL